MNMSRCSDCVYVGECPSERTMTCLEDALIEDMDDDEALDAYIEYRRYEFYHEWFTNIVDEYE